MSDKPGDDKYLHIIHGQADDLRRYTEILHEQQIRLSNYKCELENLKAIIDKFHEQYKQIEELYETFR